MKEEISNAIMNNIKAALYISSYPSYITIAGTDINNLKQINAVPFAEFPVWVPVDMLPLYVYLYKNKQNFISIFYNPKDPYKKVVRTVGPIFDLFAGSMLYNKFKIDGETIFSCKGNILNSYFSPYLRTYLHITEWDEKNGKFIKDTQKVIIDRKVFTESTAVTKYIKNTLFPVYVNNNFQIEIDDYSDVDVFYQKVKQPTLKDKEETVYTILSNNIDKMFNN